MNECKECGSALEVDAAFCAVCGIAVASSVLPVSEFADSTGNAGARAEIVNPVEISASEKFELISESDDRPKLEEENLTPVITKEPAAYDRSLPANHGPVEKLTSEAESALEESRVEKSSTAEEFVSGQKELSSASVESEFEATVADSVFRAAADQKISAPAGELLSGSTESEAASDNKVSSEFEPTLISNELRKPPKPVEEVSKSSSTTFDSVSRSYTTPNMAGSDTIGKTGTKLKPLSEGTLLNDRYEIVRKIGGGGMGAVYLANDRNLGGVLRAVKEMVQSHIEEEQQEKAIKDFRRESLLLTTLDHPSIPTIYDYFFDERAERFYLVMKYISGGDIGARLRSSPEGRIQERVVTEWAIQVADVLDYLHNHEPPIVYRDLKPSNIMIDGNTGRIMLVDFGIARWVNKDEKGVTAVGTMGYAPPELFSGSVEPRSDIYSLGSTMFHLLTGADPQSNPLLIFNFEKNPRPRQINPQLSDQIEQILIRAVEYEALRRFSNAAEFRSALVQHLSDLKLDRVTHGIVAPRPSVSPDVAVFCGFCGQKIMASDVYCPYCGVGQPSFAQSIAPVSARKTARLVVLSTNELDSPQIVLEKDENLIGRRDPISNIFPEVDLSRFDPQTKVSRRHARIWRSDNSFMIEDLGSSNGTLILRASSDGKKLVPHQPFQLSHGDKVRLGDTTLHFVMN